MVTLRSYLSSVHAHSLNPAIPQPTGKGAMCWQFRAKNSVICAPPEASSLPAGRVIGATLFMRHRAKATVFAILGLSAGWAGAQIVDVRAYGAKGDGASDDTAAIQAAMNSAADGAGGVVYLPTGTYKTSNSLLVPSRTHVKGDGRGKTVIVSPPGDYPGKSVNGARIYATIALVAADRSIISDLTVDHAANGTRANGIALMPDGATYGGTVTTNSVVQNVEVLGFNSHQYLIWNLRGAHNKILNNYVDGGIAIGTLGSIQEGIELRGGDDVLVSGNTVSNVGNNGIYVSANSDAPPSYLRGVIIADNLVDVANVGIFLSVAAYDASQIQIKHNIIRNTRMSGVAFTSASGITSRDVSIFGNSIQNTVNEGIRLYGNTGATYSGISVSHNTIDTVTSAASSGMLVYAINDTLIESNTIKNVAFGLRVQVGSSDIDIINNRVEEIARHGAIISNASNIELRGNRFKNYYKSGSGNYNGIFAEFLTKGRIIGNEFKHAGTESYAVWISRSGSSDVTIARNILDYAPTFTPPFRNDGTSPASDVLYGDVVLPTSATGLILKDRITGRRYRLRVDNGVLGVELTP